MRSVTHIRDNSLRTKLASVGEDRFEVASSAAARQLSTQRGSAGCLHPTQVVMK